MKITPMLAAAGLSAAIASAPLVQASAQTATSTIRTSATTRSGMRIAGPGIRTNATLEGNQGLTMFLNAANANSLRRMPERGIVGTRFDTIRTFATVSALSTARARSGFAVVMMRTASGQTGSVQIPLRAAAAMRLRAGNIVRFTQSANGTFTMQNEGSAFNPLQPCPSMQSHRVTRDC